MQDSKTLSIIIVSYNTKDLTIQTVQSVFDSLASVGTQHPSTSLRTGLASLQIVVVDNASTDGSVEALQQAFGKKIIVLERKSNDGFAVANNAGIQYVFDRITDGSQTRPYVVLLNSDTIVQPSALEHMVQALDANPTYGILSCRLTNPDGSYQPQGGALPTLLNLAAWWLWPLPGQIPFIEAYQDSGEILDGSALLTTGPSSRAELDLSVKDDVVKKGWIGGTAMLIRPEVMQQVGLLDEKIFMYAEDIDYCMRATKAGWKVGIVPGVTITHIGSASGSSTKAKLGEIAGLLYLFGKHKGMLTTVFLRGIFMAGAILRYLLFGILRGDQAAKKLYLEIIHTSWSRSDHKTD